MKREIIDQASIDFEDDRVINTSATAELSLDSLESAQQRQTVRIIGGVYAAITGVSVVVDQAIKSAISGTSFSLPASGVSGALMAADMYFGFNAYNALKRQAVAVQNGNVGQAIRFGLEVMLETTLLGLTIGLAAGDVGGALIGAAGGFGAGVIETATAGTLAAFNKVSRRNRTAPTNLS